MNNARHNGGPLGDGWIARHRSVRNHWLVGHGIQVKPADPTRKMCLNKGEAWEDMLMECRYEAATISNGGKKMELRRGEMVGAVSWLAARWNWTPKTVRGFLDDLKNDGMIELKNPASEKGDQKGRQANIISSCNYDYYQSGYGEVRQPKGQPEGDEGATRGRPQGNIYKEEQGNKGTKEQEKAPQTPQGGSPQLDLSPGAAPKPISGKAIARIAFTEWQEFARLHGLSVPKDTTFETFASAIHSRMREHADEPTQRGMLAVWHLALCYVAKSKWLRGMSSDFKADLGMITRPKNFAKLISGGYLNGAAPVDSRWSLASVEGTAEAKRQQSARRIIEENEVFAAAQGWVIPNQDVTRE